MEKKENLKEEVVNEQPKVEKKKTKSKKDIELDALREENEEMKKELEELTEKALRAVAELENYKKRNEKALTENMKYYNMWLIEKLLLPLDQLNIVVNGNVENPELKNYLSGFKMINDQIFDILEEEGLKLIKTDGEKFDPMYHYAVEKEEDKEKENGIILKTTQTGYLFKDRVIRPAMVTVNEWSEENGKNK
ncbi:MAG TPA: nucleotide exchange factor GrpE [Acholeplasma sp.]|nr:nucleotide exchange factor GrpE [Acholeplasma sp.]